MNAIAPKGGVQFELIPYGSWAHPDKHKFYWRTGLYVMDTPGASRDSDLKALRPERPKHVNSSAFPFSIPPLGCTNPSCAHRLNPDRQAV